MYISPAELDALEDFRPAVQRALYLAERINGVCMRYVSHHYNNAYAIIDGVKTDGTPFPRNLSFDFNDTYCALTNRSSTDVLHIHDALSYDQTARLKVTELLQIRSYVGAPILLNGSVFFGTLGIAAPEPNAFSAQDAETLKAIAAFLAAAIELEYEHCRHVKAGTYKRAALSLLPEDIPGLVCYSIRMDLYPDWNGMLEEADQAHVEHVLISRLKQYTQRELTLFQLEPLKYMLLMYDDEKPVDKLYAARQLHDHLTEPVKSGDRFIKPAVALGVSEYGEETRTHTLIQKAYMASVRSKATHRAKTVFTPPSAKAASETKSIIARDLPLALEHESFSFVYQPQFHTGTGAFSGVEVLLRWEHPDIGFVNPEWVFEVAERTGMLLEMDRWIMQKAVQNLSPLYQIQPFQVSINLSSFHADPHELAAVIRQTAGKGLIPAEHLTFELTENPEPESTEQLHLFLESLKETGVRIALDDFGKGYSSMSYIQRLPIHTLKLDRTFIQDLDTDSAHRWLVKAMVTMGRRFQLSVIAEGVETGEQLAFLKECGCPFVQGYYFARPMPLEELKKKLTMNTYRTAGS